jgi:hypothetical protein
MLASVVPSMLRDFILAIVLLSMQPGLILVLAAVLLCVLPAGAYTQVGACCTVTQQVKDQVRTPLCHTCRCLCCSHVFTTGPAEQPDGSTCREHCSVTLFAAAACAFFWCWLAQHMAAIFATPAGVMLLAGLQELSA